MIEKFYRWLKKEFRSLPVVTEQSSLEEIASSYPRLWTVLEEKYQIHRSLIPTPCTLALLSKKFDLPPPQVLFMEIQLDAKEASIQEMIASEAKNLIDQDPLMAILDVRENWERSFGSLPRSQVLNQDLLNEIQTEWSKEKRILLYCHFGVRSKDAAHYLAELGFHQVMILRGGIDAWSVQVDPSVPRYSGAYC